MIGQLPPHTYSAIRAPRSVLDIPAQSLAVAMAGQEEARLAPSRTLAMLSLPSTARAPATHAVPVIIFGPFERRGYAGSGEPTGSQRRQTLSDVTRFPAIVSAAKRLAGDARRLTAILELCLPSSGSRVQILPGAHNIYAA